MYKRLLGVAVVFATLAIPSVAFAASADQPERKPKVMIAPAYPEVAKLMHLSGAVNVQIAIAKDGSVSVVKVIGGHPLLADAAVNAVKKWRYEPGLAETKDIHFVFHPQN
jgi:TonB family protein